MKKLAFIASQVVIAAGALSFVASAQENPAEIQSKLVQIVRTATLQYQNISTATAAGYGPFLGCVSGTDHGAMGIHYVNPTLLGNLKLDPAQPKALIYLLSNGKLPLAAVKVILRNAPCLAANNNTPPVL